MVMARFKNVLNLAHLLKKLKKFQPDYIVILPWNIKQEVRTQLSYVRERGGKFVTAVPTLQVD